MSLERLSGIGSYGRPKRSRRTSRNGTTRYTAMARYSTTAVFGAGDPDEDGEDIPDDENADQDCQRKEERKPL